MASSYTPTVVNQGFNQEIPLNTNFTDIKTALDQCLQRLQTIDDAMESDLDMADNQILNLPTPTSPTDAVRLQDVNTLAIEEVVQTLEFASTINIDSTTLTVAKIVLTGNTTITITGTPSDQKPLLIMLTQDATGSRIVTWDGTRERFSDDSPSPTLSTTGLKLDYLLYRYNADDNKFDLLATNRGF